jgi:hypothetical protein
VFASGVLPRIILPVWRVIAVVMTRVWLIEVCDVPDHETEQRRVALGHRPLFASRKAPPISIAGAGYNAITRSSVLVRHERALPSCQFNVYNVASILFDLACSRDF